MTERVVDRLVARFRELGVKRMFGVPGGGSSLDLIEAANRVGIDFVLCRTETGAGLMAAVSAELTDVPGVVLTGIGPSAACVVNAVAYASLERAPLIVITDADDQNDSVAPHQVFDQRAMFAPITKTTLRLDADTAGASLDAALNATLSDPRGPVHFDLSANDARALIGAAGSLAASASPDVTDTTKSLSDMAQLLSAHRRPVLIVGHQMRRAGLSEKVCAFAEALGCPVLVTYKAKGVVADDHPQFVGIFTGATAESDTLSKADLVLTLGVDPIEMIPSPWLYDVPVGVVMQNVSDEFPFAVANALDGNLKTNIEGLMEGAVKSDWGLSEIAELRERMRARVLLKGDNHTSETIMSALIKAAPVDARLTVDAGAHMFSAMTRWPASRPHDILKSHGLSTMGFALPAAIASYLEDPSRPIIAVSGDGGMLMCLAELSTAARLNIPVTVVVMNDAALSLIDIKQQHLQHPVNGVRYPAVDFATAAKGLGCEAWSVGEDDPLDEILAQALATKGPSLIDVTTNPDGYLDQLAAIRK